MAKEYIEREATIELLRSIGSRDYRREKGTIQEAIKMVSFSEYTPAADVVEVRHGKWIHSEIEDDDYGRIFHKWTCSVCGYSVAHNPTGENYCPHCGAKMGADTQEREGV